MKPSTPGQVPGSKPSGATSRPSTPTGTSSKIQLRPSDDQKSKLLTNSKLNVTPSAVTKDSSTISVATGSGSSLQSRIPRLSTTSMQKPAAAVSSGVETPNATTPTSAATNSATSMTSAATRPCATTVPSAAAPSSVPSVPSAAATPSATSSNFGATKIPAAMATRIPVPSSRTATETRIPTIDRTATVTIIRKPYPASTLARTETYTVVAATSSTESGRGTPSRIPKFMVPRHIPKFVTSKTTHASVSKLPQPEITPTSKPELAIKTSPVGMSRKKVLVPIQRPKPAGYRAKYSKAVKKETTGGGLTEEDSNLPRREAPLVPTFDSKPAAVPEIPRDSEMTVSNVSSRRKISDPKIIKEYLKKISSSKIPVIVSGDKSSTTASVLESPVLKTAIEVSNLEKPIEMQDAHTPVEILDLKTHINTPAFKAPVETVSLKSSIETPTLKTPVRVPTLITLVKQPTPNTPVESPTLRTPIETPTLKTPIETPTLKTPVRVPTLNTLVKQPTLKSPVEPPTLKASIQTPTLNVPVETTTLKTPVRVPTLNTLVKQPTLKTPVEPPTLKTSIETPTLKVPVETPTLKTPVRVPTLNTLVNQPTLNTPVEPPTLKTPVETPTLESPIETPTLKASIETLAFKTPIEIPFLKTPAKFPSWTTPFEDPNQKTPEDFQDLKMSNEKSDLQTPSKILYSETPIEIQEFNDISESPSDIQVFLKSAEPPKRSPVNKIPIPIKESENNEPTIPFLVPKNPVKNADRRAKLAEAKARRAKAMAFGRAKLKSHPKKVDIPPTIVEPIGSENTTSETEEDRRSSAAIEARLAALEEKIAAAEAEQKSEDDYTDTSDLTPTPDIISIRSSPVLYEFAPNSSEFMTDEERSEAIVGVIQELQTSEEFTRRNQCTDVQFLLQPREFEYSTCEIGTTESSVMEVIHLARESTRSEIRTVPSVPEVSYHEPETDIRPRDVNNNIIEDQDSSSDEAELNESEITIKNVEIEGEASSESKCSFKSCTSVKTRAMKLHFLDPRLFNSDGDYNDQAFTELWNDVVLQLRQELEFAQTPSRRRIRLPRIQGPDAEIPRVRQPQFSSTRFVVNRMSSSFLPIQPDNEDQSIGDVTQKELEMLFRARLPKIFTENELPLNGTFTSYFMPNDEGYVKEFQTMVINLAYAPPVYINTTLPVTTKWFRSGIFGNIVLKNRSPHVVTYRVRASADDRYRVTPPIGCVRAGKKVKIYMETNEGRGYEALKITKKDRLMIELIPITEPFKNMLLLYVFWDGIALAEYRHVIQSIIPKSHCSPSPGKLNTIYRSLARHLESGNANTREARDYWGELIRAFITLAIMKMLIYWELISIDAIHSYRHLDSLKLW